MTTDGEPVGSEFDYPPEDPLALLRTWWQRAQQLQVPGAAAMSLATVDADGAPSVRFVAIADIRADGVIFSTDDRSPKAREMTQNPRVALAAHWEATGQQFRVQGVITALPASESDLLFAALPPPAQAALLVARQSADLDSHQELVRRAETLTSTPASLVRPPHWRSWLISPEQVQFWVEDPRHVHRRLAYIRTVAGWSARRLQP